MSATRVPAERGREVRFIFDGELVTAYEGETVAAALIAGDVLAFGITREGEPRAPLCNMGTCFDCVVTVDGAPFVRACLTDVRDDMTAESHEGM